MDRELRNSKKTVAIEDGHKLYRLIRTTDPCKLRLSEVIRESDDPLIHSQERWLAR